MINFKENETDEDEEYDYMNEEPIDEEDSTVEYEETDDTYCD